MNAPASAREALIAEAIGDMVGLLDRIEAVIPALDGSRQALADAGGLLSRQLEGLEGQMAAIRETARTQVVQHVVQRIDEAAQRAREAQARVLADATRVIFAREVDRALQWLMAEIRSVNRPEPAWVPWLTHAAAAAVAATATWVLMQWLWAR